MSVRNTIVAASVLFLIAHALSADAQKKSALQYHQVPPLPPQMVDLSVYDDVIELQCDEQKNYINFNGSRLNPVTKINVSCRLDTKHDKLAPLKEYEDLWYCQSDPIGCKKLHPLAVKSRDQVAILVINERLNDAEIAALATALVALRLELSLNRNLIAVVRIPNETLAPLVDQLRKQNFVPYKDLSRPVQTLIPIPLETNLGKRETLSFQRPQS